MEYMLMRHLIISNDILRMLLRLLIKGLMNIRLLSFVHGMNGGKVTMLNLIENMVMAF